MKSKDLILPLLLIVIIILISFSGNFSNSIGLLEVNKKIESKIFDKYKNKYIFVFFGYVGCSDICTPRLNELSPIYQKLVEDGLDLQVVFVNMIELKDKEQPYLFASSFNKNFDGIYLQKDELTKIQREFDIFNIPSLLEDGEYDHTSFLFVLKKQLDGYNLKRIYTHVPFDKKTIIEDIKKGF